MWVGFGRAAAMTRRSSGQGPVPGLVYATGHHRNGILLAPVTAEAIATLVMDGSRRSAGAEFGIERFAQAGGRGVDHGHDSGNDPRQRRGRAAHRRDAGRAAGEKGIDVDGKGIAVALNGQVVRRAGWTETRLSPGDNVEIVRARQGG